MYQRYEKSAACYVYLMDLHAREGQPKAQSQIYEMKPVYQSDPIRYPLGSTFKPEHDLQNFYEQVAQCRWFTRGWTLQELLAPRKLRFFDLHWNLRIWLDKKEFSCDSATTREPPNLVQVLEAITGINHNVLEESGWLRIQAIATRLSWAAHRKTTRLEDHAYCLLGLLGVNMPLLYGEGARAFSRIQEELFRTSTDLSVLCWEPHEAHQVRLLLAPDCYCFRNEGGARHD